MTYLYLNIVFITILAGILIVMGQLQKLSYKPILLTLAILLITTAVFDSVIIALGLVTYDAAKILGVYIGKAPIEDFGYALVVAVIVPVLWKLQGKSHE